MEGKFSVVRNRGQSVETKASSSNSFASLVKRSVCLSPEQSVFRRRSRRCSHCVVFSKQATAKKIAARNRTSSLEAVYLRHFPSPKMSTTTLPRGTLMILLPEDTSDSVTSPAYAKVKSSRGAAVTASIESDDDANATAVKVMQATAPTRKVGGTEAAGLRLGTWVRKEIWDGYYH